jgi:drug/metabolite transporter (DMT)-like permease
MQRGQVFAALLVVQLLFSINYIVSKDLLSTFPPLIWGTLRVIVTAALMLFIAALSRKKAPPFSKSYVFPLIAFAFLGVMINQGAFLLGLQRTTATNSAVINTLIPIFTLMIVTLRGQEEFTFKKGLGFLFALVGVLSLRKIEEFQLNNSTVVGDLLTSVNCLSYACFLSFSKEFLKKYDRLWTTGWLFFVGAIGFSLFNAQELSQFQWPQFDSPLLYSISFAILGGTLAAYFLNIWALAQAQSSAVALFIYLQPIFTALVAWLWRGEQPSLRSFISTAFIFLGMMLGLQNKPKNP